MFFDGIVGRLQKEKSLVLYLDLRSRSFHDFSGYGNDGVPSNVYWGNEGIVYPSTTSHLVVPDSPELQLTEGTLILLAKFDRRDGYETYFCKRDAGGVNYHIQCSNGGMHYFYDGIVNRSIRHATLGKRYKAINFKSGEAAELFVEGVSAGLFNGISTVTADDAPIEIGNKYNNSGQIKSSAQAALIVNRKLTTTEHFELYTQLRAMK